MTTRRPLLLLLLCSLVFAKDSFEWMCLEQCGFSSTEIQAHLKEIQQHNRSVDAVTFSRYTVGLNGELLAKNTTDVGTALAMMGIDPYPVIASVDESWEGMWPRFRALFSNPEPFFAQVIRNAKDYNYSGYGIEFVPVDGFGTADDLTHFIDFVGNFSAVLHDNNMKLVVHQLYGASVLCSDPGRVAAAGVDWVSTLAHTYVADYDQFVNSVNRYLQMVPADKLSVGLSRFRGAQVSNTSLTSSEVDERFKFLHQTGVGSVEVWMAPLADFWYTEMEQWRAS